MKNSNLIYLTIPTKDYFQGISFNQKFSKLIEFLIKNNKLFNNYKLYRNYVEYQMEEIEYILQNIPSKGLKYMTDDEVINFLNQNNIDTSKFQKLIHI